LTPIAVDISQLSLSIVRSAGRVNQPARARQAKLHQPESGSGFRPTSFASSLQEESILIASSMESRNKVFKGAWIHSCMSSVQHILYASSSRQPAKDEPLVILRLVRRGAPILRIHAKALTPVLRSFL
jgi:hypothetical protein